jgi:hypothetical protein
MRVHYFKYVLDKNGNPISGATVKVYKAGTLIAANIYVTETGGVAVTQVETAPDGSFEFWIDSEDYDAFTQEFKILVEKSGVASRTFDYVNIYPLMPHTHSVIGSHGSLSGLGSDDHPQYSRADGTRAFTGNVSGIDPVSAAHLSTKNYVDQKTDILSIFGAWEEKIVNTIYTATTDGFITTVPGSVAGHAVLETPVGIPRSGSTRGTSDDVLGTIGFVRKGDSWEVLAAAGVVSHLYWLPLSILTTI